MSSGASGLGFVPAISFCPVSLDPARPPGSPQGPGQSFLALQRQYVDVSVFDGSGGRVSGAPGGGGTLPRTRPYAWHEETIVVVPGPGQYTLQLGCVSPPPLVPAGRGFAPEGPCVGGPVATIPIVVS
jgi:hypothetical protein